jgi:hypothetical protein
LPSNAHCEEKLHGNSLIARAEAHALVALMRQFQSGHVDVDTEAGSLTRTPR